MSEPKTVAGVFLAAYRTLQAAEEGLAQLKAGRGPQKVVGLMNVATWGRAVTNVLQNLRSTVTDFDRWYQPYVEEMRHDPLLRYFYELRSRVLKEGETGARGGNVYVKSFRPERDLARFGPAPAGATGFFMGDQTGGSGWMVELADGTKEPIYVDLPPEIGRTWLSVEHAPTKHLGRPIDDVSAEHLGELYLAYMRKLVILARQQFPS